MPERFQEPPKKIEGAPNLENDKRGEKIKELVALARALSESQEAFPFSGIDSEALSKMRATDIQFPAYTTPVDDLLQRFQTEGMRVVLGKNPESGNVYIVPAGETNPPSQENMYVFPRDLDLNAILDVKIRKLTIIDKAKS